MIMKLIIIIIIIMIIIMIIIFITLHNTYSCISCAIIIIIYMCTIYIHRISLNIGPGVNFLPASFDPALKRGRRLNGVAFIIKLMYGTLEFS